MHSLARMKKPFQAAMEEDWKGMKNFYDEEGGNVLLPLTVAKDTAFHLAVYSKSKEPLQHFLQLVDDPMESYVFSPNEYGNTVLHEAAANGNFEAAKLLMLRKHNIKLVESRNKFGETPLFMAAAFGSRKIVKLLASQPGQLTADKKLKDVHRRKGNNISILHVAIQGQHFGTALELLNLDESLAEMKDRGMTSLQLLAHMPSAFRTGFYASIWEKLLYFCLPVGSDHNDVVDGIDDDDNVKADGTNHSHSVDLESGQSKNKNRRFLNHRKGLPIFRKIWEEKRKHKLAFELARKLIAKDTSWENSSIEDVSSLFRVTGIQQSIKHKEEQLGEEGSTSDASVTGFKVHEEKQASKKDKMESELEMLETPLLEATKRGILEIVNEILLVHPQAVEHCGKLNQNILHLAVLHRQKEIFRRVKKMKVAMNRLVRGIDKNGYSILHHAADMKHYTGGSHPGPAYQLQEELKWFKRVHKIMPKHYVMHRDSEKKLTARELFKEQHKDQLKAAQKWIKETSQSCSAVAVLVATVVFAAAYTVPGGSNEMGVPVFLNSPLFLVFMVMDVVGLASSLTAVVMFLSVLTSPFEFKDFHHSLPRKLTLGFALLFFSVATTMLAFTATILLIIRLEPRQSTTTLIYTAAFLPVGILALTQFPVFVAFTETLVNFSKMIRKVVSGILSIGNIFRLSKCRLDST